MHRRGSPKAWLGVILGVGLVAAASQGWLAPLDGVLDHTVVPVGRWFARAGTGAGGFVRTFGSARDLADENGRLKHQVAELREHLAGDAELKVQNESLRRQLSFGEAVGQKLIPAEVTAYQPDNFRSYLTIGRGSREGIKAGQAVISEGALVGRVVEVGPGSAKVFVMNDPEFRVGGLDQQTRASGTVKGQLGGGLVMEKIAQSDSLKPGDTIVTSGLGGDLPKGIIIGLIDSVDQKDNQVFQTARINSSLKFAKLELVFVVQE